MWMNDKYWISFKTDGSIWTNCLRHPEAALVPANDPMVKYFKDLRWNVRQIQKRDDLTEDQKNSEVDNLVAVLLENAKESIAKMQCTEHVEETVQKLMNFFSEFQFEPNFRFINTFAYAAIDGRAADYTRNYFALIDHQYAAAINEKIKSTEFKEVAEALKDVINITKKDHINKRFKLYYGSAGTGKTTAAMNEADDNCMVCHSAMLPNDLMEDFEFIDGKATFKPSALQTAIVEGKMIVLDEINLLPFESLRFLQSMLDGKSEFIYKGKTVKIADGFQIIGTMNLQINGSIFSLPEPLVDRAADLKEFKLTAANLVGALI